MKYHQLTSAEKISAFGPQEAGLCRAEIARALGRHHSTITREIARNSRKDGG
jgi:IS30 family transposase